MLKNFGVQMRGMALSLLGLGSFVIIISEASATPDCTTAAASLATSVHAEWRFPKALKTKSAIHALYFSQEARVLAARLGVRRPNFGEKDVPHFGVMDVHSRFMNYFVDFLMALQAKPELMAKVEAWLQTVDQEYRSRSDAAWKREFGDAFDRWETDPAWSKGRVEFQLRYVRMESQGGPSNQKIFLAILNENPLERFIGERLSGQRLIVEHIDSAVPTGEARTIHTSFDEELAEQNRLMKFVADEIKRLPQTGDYDPPTTNRAIEIMRAHTAVLKWAVKSWSTLGKAAKNERRLLLAFVNDFVRSLHGKQELRTLRGFESARDYKFDEVSTLKGEWIEALYQLESQVPVPEKRT